jgi:hypothetical protein
VLLACAILLGRVALKRVHPFLAVTDSAGGGILVVEGWAADYALEDAIREFRSHPYSRLYVVGVPLERGAPLSEYKTYAELGAATLGKLGLETNAVQAVPAPLVVKDRTYSSAVALRDWLRARGIAPLKVNVLSVGAHARRSRLLFEKAFGDSASVGVIAVESRDYDPQRWWISSDGVREVISEMIGYVYARFFFRPAGQA